MSEEPTYKLRWRGRETEFYSLAEINQRLDDHEIGMGHEVRYQHNWITLEEFFRSINKKEPASVEPTRAVSAFTPENISIPSAKTTPRSPRSRLVFALLGIFAGFLGLHNFYARQWLTGLLQLLLTAATLLMGFGVIASWIWAVVEAIFVSKDGEGLDLI
jgi:TM2 domain-containing membrane protein YozV